MTSLRVRVTDSWSLRYPLTPGRHMRGAAFARCTVPGLAGAFVVAGSHLSTYDGERLSQAALLQPHLRAVSEPLILGADLNEPDSGASWKLLLDGLVDTGSAPTYPAAHPDRRIDAVFVSTSVKVTDCFVVATDAALRASDHRPILLDFELPA